MNPADPASPGNAPTKDISAMMNWALGEDASTEIISTDNGQRAARPAADHAGTVIGVFTLVKQLGHGGFGEVWQAEQHKPIRRTVALKLIKLGMASADVLQRFDAERQALAMMDHPNIARVFDAGATPDGRPWFAMELVDGAALTTYCDSKRLTIRQRLDLFIKVCAAVQHAHQKAVLHRDLKPSNILVTEIDGQTAPKVIDFGIAKAVQADVFSDSTLLTQHNQLLGTPRFMSPEQIDGSASIDTRTDIYSLGVLLYKLLTGVPPFEQDTSVEEMKRLICETTPYRPSTQVRRLRRLEKSESIIELPLDDSFTSHSSDLDWITMRALEKDRNRRYQTAAEFAADVRRFLDGEPVQTLWKRQPVGRAPLGDGFPFDQLHGEVGATIQSQSGIQQRGDAGVIQARE